MSRKNFKVATAEDGKTTLVQIEKNNVPTGKVVTLEDKKKRKEEREKAYRAFRINALKRRAKRMKLSDEDTKNAVEKLVKQLDEPTNYMILMLYSNTIKSIVEEMILNNKLKWLMKSDSHMYIRGDKEILNKLREIMPEGVKIHPYTEKKPAILPVKEPPRKVDKKPLSKAEKKAAALAAKKARKASNIEKLKNRKKKNGKAYAIFQKRAKLKARKKAILEYKKAKAGKTVQLSDKKSSTALKKAA